MNTGETSDDADTLSEINEFFWLGVKNYPGKFYFLFFIFK